MKTTTAVDLLWQHQADLVRSFLNLQPRAIKLCAEVAYILEELVKASHLEYSSVTHRAKTLDSFCEKITRKNIKEPFKEITDFAGARIVYLYNSDLPKIESLIENEFEIVEKINKTDTAGADRFGYGALHYLVKLGNNALGARYNNIKDLVCEIQVRTILQDAWAIVAHHLSYKQEADVPLTLRRKLNALSGLFSTADDQFNLINIERENYITESNQQAKDNSPAFLKQEINLDNLSAYIQWRLPDRIHKSTQELVYLLEEMKKFGYHKINQLEKVVNATYDAFVLFEKESAHKYMSKQKDYKFYAVGVIRTILALADDNYLKNMNFSLQYVNDLKAYRQHIKPIN